MMWYFNKILILSLLLTGCRSELMVGVANAIKGKGMTVDYIYPQIGQAGDEITIRGHSFTEDMTVELNGVNVPLTIVNSKTATLILPETTAEGINTLGFFKKSEKFATLNLANQKTALTVSTLPASSVCLGVIYLDKDGVVNQGTQICDSDAPVAANILECSEDGENYCLTTPAFPAVNRVQVLEARAGDRDATMVVAGVVGTMKACDATDSACYVLPYDGSLRTLKALNINGITPSIIKFGSTLAGVAGSLVSRPADCATASAVGCVTNSDFPAVDLSILQLEGDRIRDSLTLAQISGLMSTCSSLDSDCYIPSYAAGTQTLKAISFDSITADVIKSGTSIAGVNGILQTNPPNCSIDGESACLATSTFPVMNKSLAIANKIETSLTIGGVAGTLSPCAADGATGCLASTAYPASDRIAITADKAKILSTLTVGGVTGTLGNCADNGSGCFLPAYVMTTQPRKAISFDALSAAIIRNGTSIAGINGNVVAAPANCAADAGTGCVAVTDFPAMKLSQVSGLQTKILSGLTLGGIAGTLGNCAAEGATNCLAGTSFPAIDKNYVTANIAKIRTNQTLVGIAGTLVDCASDNATNCFTATNFPAIEVAAVNSLKADIHSSLTVAGITGTLSDCAGNDANCYLGPYNSSTQPLKSYNSLTLAAADIKSGVSIAGLTGTMVPKPNDCAADAATGCVATTAFPAMDKVAVEALKSKIMATQVVGGVTGTMNDCSSDGQSTCRAVTDFPALSVSTVTSNKSKFRSGSSIAGVSGSIADCMANGSDCFVRTYASGSQDLKAINFDNILGTKLRSSTSIAGVAGTVLARPADCALENSVGCTTVSAFPSIDKNNFNSNTIKVASNLTLVGIAGTLTDCNAEAQTSCLTATDFPALDSNRLTTRKAEIRSGLTLNAVAGTLADCSANSSDCFLPTYSVMAQHLKALRYDNLNAGLIKSGTSFAGITGDYPSSTYPLTPGDAYTDLSTSSFTSLLSNAANFGWFDRNGTRHVQLGSADLLAANIKNNVDVFGISGSLPILNPWNVRAGTSYGTSAVGKLKMDCRNPASSATWNIGLPKVATWSSQTITSTAHGFVVGDAVRFGYNTGSEGSVSDATTYYVKTVPTANTFKVSTTSGGALFTVGTGSGVVFKLSSTGLAGFKNVTLYTNGGAVPTENPWSSVNSNNLCSGVEATTDDDKVWRDTTVGGCTGPYLACRYMDKITRLEWTKPLSALPFTTAIGYCNTLTYDGQTGWRLPTINELSEAAAHQISGVQNVNWIPASDLTGTSYMSGTKVGDGDFAWVATLSKGELTRIDFSVAKDYMCVRSGTNP